MPSVQNQMSTESDMNEVYLNGEFMPLTEARVPVMDRGFLFGDGVYEVIPVYGGYPFRLSQHLERLDRSLQSVRMENPLQPDAWERIFARLTDSASDLDQLIYLQVTRGADQRRNHLFPQGIEPTVLVMTWTLGPRDPEISSTGVAAVVLEDNRWHRCDIKATALLGNVLLQQEAQDAAATEAILVRDGLVTEGSSTNPFVVQGGGDFNSPREHPFATRYHPGLGIEARPRCRSALRGTPHHSGRARNGRRAMDLQLQPGGPTGHPARQQADRRGRARSPMATTGRPVSRL